LEGEEGGSSGREGTQPLGSTSVLRGGGLGAVKLWREERGGREGHETLFGNPILDNNNGGRL